MSKEKLAIRRKEIVKLQNKKGLVTNNKNTILAIIKSYYKLFKFNTSFNVQQRKDENRVIRSVGSEEILDITVAEINYAEGNEILLIPTT